MVKIVLIAGYGKDDGKTFLEVAPKKFGSDWIEETMRKLGIKTALVAFWVDLDYEFENDKIDFGVFKKLQMNLDKWLGVELST